MSRKTCRGFYGNLRNAVRDELPPPDRFGRHYGMPLET